jgi:hypothetical protein
MRLYCIGDAYMAMESFHRVLRENNVVDNNLKWSVGNYLGTDG